MDSEIVGDRTLVYLWEEFEFKIDMIHYLARALQLLKYLDLDTISSSLATVCSKRGFVRLLGLCAPDRINVSPPRMGAWQ